MSLITDVRFAHDDGALAYTLGQLPEVDARVIRESSTTPRARRYYIRVENDSRERIEAVLDDDHTVQEVSPMPTFDHQQVWVVTFDPGTKLLGPKVTDSGGLVIDARSSKPMHAPRGWDERWLLPDQEAVHDIWQRARDEGFSFELLEVHRGGYMEAKDLGRNALTEQQRLALETAHEEGYFAEPRGTSLEALGEALDLSASAVGGRLKRGMRSLIGATLVVDRPGGGHVTDGDGTERVPSDAGRPAPGRDLGGTQGDSTMVPPTGVGEEVSETGLRGAITLDVYVEHPSLALSPTIRSLPSVDIGVVSDAGTDPDHAVYFFWVEAADLGAVEEAFEEDPTVAAYEPVMETEDRRTYGIEYSDEAHLISPALTDMGVIVHESRSHSNGWLLTLHLQDHETLNEVDGYLDHTAVHFEVFELQRGSSVQDETLFDLTETQIEALVCAYVQGYYDDPREISLEALGSILGLSQTAVSGRLRRGSARLIEGVLEV